MPFCDTSTLAKYYVQEPQTPAVKSAFDSAERVMLSELAKVELLAAFHRRLREGKWTQDDFNATVRQFQKDDTSGYWTWLRLESVIMEQAGKLFLNLPSQVFLRSADCLHLVTALHHGFTEIHTHDRHQALAASALGLKPVCLG